MHCLGLYTSRVRPVLPCGTDILLLLSNFSYHSPSGLPGGPVVPHGDRWWENLTCCCMQPFQLPLKCFIKNTSTVQRTTTGKDQTTTEVSLFQLISRESYWNTSFSLGCEGTESLRIKLPRQPEVLHSCLKVMADSNLLSSRERFAV